MTVRLRPGLCSVTFRALAADDVIALAREAGLEGIEWGGDVHVPPGDLTLARQVGAATRAAGLAVVSYGSYARLPGDDTAAFAAVLEATVALGAPNVRVWAGERGRASATYAADERAAVSAQLRNFCTAAASRGVSVSLEYHPGSLTDELGSARSLLAAAASPNLFTYWQPRPGLPITIALAEVAALAPDLSHLHAFAWDAQSTRHPLRSAEAFWRGILGALTPSRWAGDRFALLEFVRDDDPTALREDAEVLRWMLSADVGSSQQG